MTKSELIKQLKAIQGDPVILVKETREGKIYDIDEIDEGTLERQNHHEKYTFSKEKKEEEPDLQDCIILWI